MSATAFQRLRREAAAKKEAEAEKGKGPNIAEIKLLLDEKGIEYDDKAKKAELIKLLEGAE